MSLAAAFAAQADSCAALGSPFTARLMRLCARRLTPDHGAVAARLHAWPGDVGSRGASLPLRLAGALNALRLAGHAGLGAVYPPAPADDAALWAAVSAALRDDADRIDPWLDLPPQTNEVGRAAAFRLAAHHLAARADLPMAWSELGASAGLNLVWDAFATVGPDWRRGPDPAALTLAPDWSGPPPPDTAPRVADRRGVDLRPFTDAARLLP